MNVSIFRTSRLVIVLLVQLLVSTCTAENLYVTPGGSGSHSGADWNNAFTGMGGVVWGSGAGQLGAGDTLWIAGGTYTSGFTVSQPSVTIRRASSTYTQCTSAAGWNSTFDSTVTITSAATQVIYCAQDSFTLDGVSPGGILINATHPWDGLPSGTTVQCSAIRFVSNNCTFQYITTKGAAITSQWQAGFHVGSSAVGVCTGARISYCEIYNSSQGIFCSPTSGLTVEGCSIHTTYASNGIHNNCIYLDTAPNITLRNNQLYDYSASGISFFPYGAGTDNVQIYGNRFGPNSPGSSGVCINIDPELGATLGTHFYMYNNVGYQTYGALLRCVNRADRNQKELAGGYFYNNICYGDSTLDSGDNAITHDYNWFSVATAYSAIEPHAIVSTVNPFVSSGTRDFHIVGTIGAAYPREKGITLTSPFSSTDPDGNTRGSDGAWDIGAYEYVTGVTYSPPATPSNTSPSNGATGVSLTPTLTASAFSDPQSLAFAAAQWRVLNGATVTYDTGTSTASTTRTIPASTLTYSTTYTWQVRYQNSAGLWSSYSPTTSFTTLAPSVPATPSNTTPANGAINIGLTPTLTASAFSDPNGAVQTASQWLLANTTNVIDSGIYLPATSYLIPVSLTNSTTYTWRVRYQNSWGLWSAYSAATSFTTTNATVIPPPPPPPPPPAPTVYTLAINSSSPASGVPIIVSPADTNGLGSATTPIIRYYTNTSIVTLTAPVSASGNTFTQWLLNNTNATSSTIFTLNMTTGLTATAVFTPTPPPPPPPATFSIALGTVNPVTGVTLSVTPADNNSLSSGSTPLTRTYTSNTVVTVTAPLTLTNGNTFLKWQLNGSDVSTSATYATIVTSATTLNALYTTPAPPPPPPIITPTTNTLIFRGTVIFQGTFSTK